MLRIILVCRAVSNCNEILRYHYEENAVMLCFRANINYSMKATFKHCPKYAKQNEVSICNCHLGNFKNR